MLWLGMGRATGALGHPRLRDRTGHEWEGSVGEGRGGGPRDRERRGRDQDVRGTKDMEGAEEKREGKGGASRFQSLDPTRCPPPRCKADEVRNTAEAIKKNPDPGLDWKLRKGSQTATAGQFINRSGIHRWEWFGNKAAKKYERFGAMIFKCDQDGRGRWEAQGGNTRNHSR